MSGLEHLETKHPTQAPRLKGWHELPLWQPHVIHLTPLLPCISRLSLGKFDAAGLHSMGDLLHADGTFKTWRGEIERTLPGRLLFERLVLNLHPTCLLNPDRNKTQSLFLEYTLPDSSRLALEFKIPRKDYSSLWRPSAARPPPYKSFTISGDILLPYQHRPIPISAPCTRIFTRKDVSKGHKRLVRIAADSHDYLFVSQYCWTDGADLFHYHTASLRLIQSPSIPPLTVGSLNGKTSSTSLWTREDSGVRPGTPPVAVQLLSLASHLYNSSDSTLAFSGAAPF